MGCVSPDSYPRKSILREPGKIGNRNTPSNSPRTWHPKKNRERKGPLRGIIQQCAPRERSPCAPKFGETSHEEMLLDSGAQLHACPLTCPGQKIPLPDPGIHTASGARLQHDGERLVSYKLPEGRTIRVLFHACAVRKPILSLGWSVILVMSSNMMSTTRQMCGASANLMMSGVRVTGKRAVGARAIGRRADGTMQTSSVLIARDSCGQVIHISRQRA